MKFSKIQQTILKKLQDGEWHDEDMIFCTRATIKALERKGAIEPHPDNGSWLNKWRLIPKGDNSDKVS